MKALTLLKLCFYSTIIGSLLLALQQEWIIIRLPQIGHKPENSIKCKKGITLHYWHDHQWHTEKQNLIWCDNTSDNIFYLITNWLNTLDAEEITNKKITLQSALLSPSCSDVYLSFDRNPLEKNWSTFQKWMWIEGLLKTIRAQQIPIQNIYFLVQHKPIIDSHLDCSHAWPIGGFLSLNQLQ